MKKEYRAPALEDLGSLEELTLGNARGNFTDADYPTGTPFGELGFS